MKYKILKPFFDKYDNGILYEEGQIIDIPKTRADEILGVGKFISKVPTQKKTTKTPSKKEV